ncbi:MAG TPA: trypsin-like peptidase domain-containing protein [bacterium]|jgi:S1-C subfamily serine protease
MRSTYRWLVVLLAFAVVAAAPSGSVAQSTALPAPIVDAVERAVVQINITFDSNGRVGRASGSGIVIDPGGLILTAQHVVARATSIDVIFKNGEAVTAHVIGTDPVFDLALVRIDPRVALPVAVLGNSSLLREGDLVTTFGRAPRRTGGPSTGAFITLDFEARPGAPYLRTTATVYPGDSGGALVNDRGEVVGVIVATARDGTFSLSVASDAVKALLPDLRAGTVRHPWLGVTGQTIDDELAAELGLPVRSGVLVFEVVDGGPAALAGLRGGRPAASPRDAPRGGDIIVAIDGRPVRTFGALAGYVLSRHIGDTVTLEILRDGRTFSVSVVLGERPNI